MTKKNIFKWQTRTGHGIGGICPQNTGQKREDNNTPPFNIAIFKLLSVWGHVTALEYLEMGLPQWANWPHFHDPSLQYGGG